VTLDCDGTDESLMGANSLPSCFSGTGESLLNVLAADVPILSRRGDWADSSADGAVGDVDWMLQTVDRSDLDVKYICNDLHSLASSQSSNRLSLVSR